MRIRVQRITEESDFWQEDCGKFTQVRLVGIMEDGSIRPLVQTMGMSAKLLAQGIVQKMGWVYESEI